jgi:hypothetical protein
LKLPRIFPMRTAIGLTSLLAIVFVPAFYGQVAGTVKDFLVNSQLPWHKAVLDANGKLLAWYQPEKNRGYDKFLRLDWDFLEHKVPIDNRTGVKVYLSYPMYDPKTFQGSVTQHWQHNPAGTFAHQMDGLIGWYPYSGDTEAIGVLRDMLDYQLAHGLTPVDWNWSRVPFATSCKGEKEYGKCLADMPLDFYGGIETDKIGELGLSYVEFYEMTGERKYLDEGVICATQLANHIRPGDAAHTPWPFRVYAKDGSVLAMEEYGGMIVGPVRLFDELIHINAGDVEQYKQARDLAWNWVLNNPLNRDSAAWDRWSGYYEDISRDPENVNDMTSITTAYYILSHDDPATVDKDWKIHVEHLIDRSRLLLGRGPFFGAWGIDEQLRPDGGILSGSEIDNALRPHAGSLLGTNNRGCCSRIGLVCRSSAWGAINAMHYAKTHDGQSLENGFRSLNYATYFAQEDGRIDASAADFNEYWFEDGYSDAGRSFAWALAAVPEFAPVGEDHLLHSMSIVQKVKYGTHSVEFHTFDNAGNALLRLSFKPVHITAGSNVLAERKDLDQEGYAIRALAGGDYEVRVRYSGSNDVRIQ